MWKNAPIKENGGVDIKVKLFGGNKVEKKKNMFFKS